MAGIKIVDLPPLGRDLASTDLLELSLAGGTGSRKITGQEIMNASKLSINNTPIINGTVGRVLFQGTGDVLQQSSSLFWDATNNRLGIGTSTPSAIIHSIGSVTASGSIARGNFFNNALVASANNDVLVGLDIQPTFTNGAFTGLENIPLRFVSQSNSNVVKNILLKNIGTGNGTGVSIGFNNLNANNLSHAFIKSYYVTPSGMAMSFGTGGGSSLTSEGTTALVLNADQTANFTARVIANSGGFQATGTTTNLLMSDNGTPVITRNGSTGIQFLKDAYWQTFSIFTNNTENLRVASTGNVLIGTTTDAGFRLDVNGTARVQGNTTIGGTTLTLNNTAAHYVTFTSSATAFDVQTFNNTPIRLNNGGGGGIVLGGSVVTCLPTMNLGGGTNNGLVISAGSGATGKTIQTYGGHPLILQSLGNNVLINTTTDAGYRLDVNGTARVSGATTFNNSLTNTLGGFIHSSATSSNDAFYTLLSSNIRFYVSANGYCKTTTSIVTDANGAGSVNASAISQIDSTTKGFLPPRMTQAQRNAIASPAIGLEIYQTDATEGKYIYKSSGWTYIG